MTSERAMAIGTAGFTAMLCVQALEDAGVTPEVPNLWGNVTNVALDNALELIAWWQVDF